MLIARTTITDMLRARGQDERAGWVERDLPDVVDTERHRGLLDLLRIDLDGIAATTVDADAPVAG